jgi:hypothetical protein
MVGSAELKMAWTRVVLGSQNCRMDDRTNEQSQKQTCCSFPFEDL